MAVAGQLLLTKGVCVIKAHAPLLLQLPLLMVMDFVRFKVDNPELAHL